jgi:hypothetical protein
MLRFASLLLATMTLGLVQAAPAGAAVRIFSYTPTTAVTDRIAGDLTFQFDQHLIFVKVLNIRSTEGRAHADLRPADEHVLGSGGLSRLIGANAQERDLYEVEPSQEGTELIHAFCPGSDRAWLAFSRLVEARPLRVQVIGDNPAGGPARLCHTLDFQFQGEWKLPQGNGVPARDLIHPKHGPY